jgi:hypothetical protein
VTTGTGAPAVLAAAGPRFSLSRLPGSGTPDELMEAAGISAARIAAAARAC